jgi:hypothetical protein
MRTNQIDYIFCKSMPRSGHWLLTEQLRNYFMDSLHDCGFYDVKGCCEEIPCAKPFNKCGSNRFFAQKSHDFDLGDSKFLKGKYLIQYRSPIPRLQSHYELHALELGRDSREMFHAFAEQQTTYFIGFFEKWIAAPRVNDLLISYEDLCEHPERTLTKAVAFIQESALVDPIALERALAQTTVLPRAPIGADHCSSSLPGSRNPRLHPYLRDPRSHFYFDQDFFAELERKVAQACGTDLISFHFHAAGK